MASHQRVAIVCCAAALSAGWWWTFGSTTVDVTGRVLDGDGRGRDDCAVFTEPVGPGAPGLADDSGSATGADGRFRIAASAPVLRVVAVCGGEPLSGMDFAVRSDRRVVLPFRDVVVTLVLSRGGPGP